MSVREIIVILASEQLEALCGVRVRAGAVDPEFGMCGARAFIWGEPKTSQHPFSLSWGRLRKEGAKESSFSSGRAGG